MKDIGKFYGHLVYVTAISYILWPCGIFLVIFVYLARFGVLYQQKSGNPAFSTAICMNPL
jgi:putative exporter of polyketide antibiotics